MYTMYVTMFNIPVCLVCQFDTELGLNSIFTCLVLQEHTGIVLAWLALPVQLFQRWSVKISPNWAMRRCTLLEVAVHLASNQRQCMKQ